MFVLFNASDKHTQTTPGDAVKDRIFWGPRLLNRANKKRSKKKLILLCIIAAYSDFNIDFFVLISCRSPSTHLLPIFYQPPTFCFLQYLSVLQPVKCSVDLQTWKKPHIIYKSCYSACKVFISCLLCLSNALSVCLDNYSWYMIHSHCFRFSQKT